MDGKLVKGIGGRRYLSQAGQPDRVALPMNCLADACEEPEIDILLRFTEASEMDKGNNAVAILPTGEMDEDGDPVMEPHGRYARFAAKVDFKRYREAEVEAYRWIIGTALGSKAMLLAEVIARMNGERMNGGYDFLRFGEQFIQAVNDDQAIGAAIGSARACAFMLMDAYKDYAEMWKARLAAEAAGLALTEDDGARRVRRAGMARAGVAAFSARLDDAS
jgi:hypothetical protein